MPIFNYYAKKISGEEIKGDMEAQDRFELARLLREDGYTLVSCKEKGNKRRISLDFLSFGNVSIADKMMFSRNLGVMIEAGLSATSALEILSRQTKNKRFKKILLSIRDSIQKGTSLSEAMKAYPRVFSQLFVAMVKVGEESGRLTESLKILGEQLERDYTLRKKVRGALVYPAIIVIAMILIGIFMLIYVVPTLVSSFRELEIELPVSTKIIISVSDFFISHSIAALFIVIALILMLAWAARTEKGKRIFGNILLHIPLISPIVKKMNSSRTSRTLASLVSSGVNLLEAITITKDVLQNYRYKQVLEEARVSVQKGTPVSTVFKKADKIYPILVGEMMAVGEETGKFSEMLNRLASFYEEEVANATKDLTTVIEPLLMIFIGAAVGFFAISMIKPMYSMVSGI